LDFDEENRGQNDQKGIGRDVESANATGKGPLKATSVLVLGATSRRFEDQNLQDCCNDQRQRLNGWAGHIETPN